MTWRERLQDEKFAEIASVILLSMSTFLSAWCAYEATVWTGRQSLALASSGVYYRNSMQKQLEGNQRVMVDVMQFVPYLDATQSNNDAFRDFQFHLFRPELQAATRAWLATKPRENPHAPRSPFAMPQFSVSEWQESQRFSSLATKELREAHEDNFNSDVYVLITVLLAFVLFAAGVAPKLVSATARWMLLGMGVFFFLVAAIWIAQRPVAISRPPAFTAEGDR